ncbi:hypothetical protein TDB9533_00674 [Thalassocella blandensis]|nr:hypothetical protein TDB9533_00674 [Thalassocella blandensis]
MNNFSRDIVSRLFRSRMCRHNAAKLKVMKSTTQAGVKLWIALLLLFMSIQGAHAEISVIVHKSNADSISAQDIEKIFLGKQSNFPGGHDAVPVNLKEGNAAREGFDSQMLKKNSRQVKAYWSRLVFTGKGTPPKEVERETHMLELVASNPSMIGYIDSRHVTPDVKVIFSF